MADSALRLHFRIFGTFTVTGSDGQNVTPRSAKSQALLALLLDDADLTRSRRWLQQMLWSDRGPTQAAGSLRQALTDIRRALGGCAEILGSNRGRVWLDPTRVSILKKDGDSGGYLEGMNVRDPEFAHWLSQKRRPTDSGSQIIPLRHLLGNNDLGAKMSKRVVLDLDVTGSPTAAHLRDLLADSLSCRLRETSALSVRRRKNGVPCDGALVVGISATPLDGGTTELRLSIEDHDTGAELWCGGDTIRANTEQVAFQVYALANRAHEALDDTAIGPLAGISHDQDPTLLANLAVRKIFTLKAHELETADRLLDRAYEIQPNGVFLAWRAQIGVIQAVERFRTDLDVLAAENEAFCTKAMAVDPMNSVVLAAVANSRAAIERNAIGAAELARMAVNTGPANPFAWFAFSNALQYVGLYKEAHVAAARADVLSEGTRMRFWCASQRALAAAFVRRFDEAAGRGELAAALVPEFRAVHRINIAVHANRGDVANATRSAAGLSSLEKDFSIDRMLKDPEYPIRAMRMAGLMDTDRLQRLGDEVARP